MFDKPISMSIKDFLIRKLAISLLTEEKVIEAVVNHQFTSALSATQTCKEIEISGFGKMFFNDKKAASKYQKQLQKMEYFTEQLSSPNNSPARLLSLTNKLNNTIEAAQTLKPRINYELLSNLRGLEKQASDKE
jgi:nucleoid DNA-binding protein